MSIKRDDANQRRWQAFLFKLSKKNLLRICEPEYESEKWKWSRSVVSDSLQPHGL